jgi:hypothetical protein
LQIPSDYIGRHGGVEADDVGGVEGLKLIALRIRAPSNVLVATGGRMRKTSIGDHR